jgi:hypothetical protein
MRSGAVPRRAWTLAGAVFLGLAVGVAARKAAQRAPAEELRDAVAAPVAPAAVGLPRGAAPAPSYFATPSSRRAEAEAVLLSRRRQAARSVAAE